MTRESSFLDAATREQEGQIDFSSSQLRLSSDGTVLAAAANNEDFQYVTDRTVKVFALPSGAEIQSIPYAYPGPLPQDIALSGSGQVLGKLVSTYSDRWAYRREVTPVGGGRSHGPTLSLAAAVGRRRKTSPSTYRRAELASPRPMVRTFVRAARI